MPPTTTTKSKKASSVATPPPWGRELMEKFGAGVSHAFILHGNVQDYVAGIPGQNLRDYLISSLAGRDIIVVYNRASGFYFPLPAHRRRFAEVVLGEVTTPNNRGGIAGALNGVAGGAAEEKIEQMGRQPLAALGLLTKLMRAQPATGQPEMKAAIVIEYAETLCPNGDSATMSEADRTAYVTLAEWAGDKAIADSNKIIIMIAAETQNLNEKLRKSGSRWEQIEIPFPTPNGRARFAKKLLESPENGYSSLADGFSYDDLARITNGLRLIDIEDLALRATFKELPITRELANDVKNDIVKSEFDEILEVVEATEGFGSLGGLSELKQALRQNVIEPMRAGQHRIVPQGILMMGPAGTGKSRIARALAAEAGFTFVVLNPAKIFNKWVGSTEQRLEKAMTAIKAMAPVIVFIDEIDQAISRGEGGDSGTSNRVFKRLMEIMSDTSYRGKILWLGATNRPDLLDAALLRPGRFDEKIPVLAPDADERASILEVLTRQAFGEVGGNNFPAAASFLELASKMEGYTGAEIELVVSKALKVHARATPPITIAVALERAFDLIIPTTQDVEQMTALALQHCSDLDLVPEVYRAQARMLRARKKADSAGDDGDIPTESAGRKARSW